MLSFCLDSLAALDPPSLFCLDMFPVLATLVLRSQTEQERAQNSSSSGSLAVLATYV